MTDTINHTPAEKARGIIEKFMPFVKDEQKSVDGESMGHETRVRYAKQCALIAVELVLENLYEVGSSSFMYEEYEPTLYWEAVREAIKVL